MSADELRVFKMCGGNPDCEAGLRALVKAIKKPRYIGSNRCFSFMDQVMDDIGFDNSKGFMDSGDGTMRLTPQILDPNRFVPTTKGRLWGWYGMTEHGIMQVQFKPTGQIAYFDIGSNTHLGSLGGDDHWFFPEDQVVAAKTKQPVHCVKKVYIHGSEENRDD